MKLSQGVSKAREVDVEFDGGGVLHVTYRPVDYTPRQLNELSEAMRGASESNAQEALDRASLALMRTVVKWDLTDDDDVPIPLEVEPLRDVPLNIMTEVIGTIARDQNAGEAARPSDAG